MKAFHILKNWKITKNNTTKTNPNKTKCGITGQIDRIFLQHSRNNKDGKTVGGIYGHVMMQIMFYKCRIKYHYLDQFPNNNDVNEETGTKTEATSCTVLYMIQYIVCITAATITRGHMDIINK